MNRRGTMAFYVECLLLTVFLLALSAVLVQLFSAARAEALQARRLTDAQRLAQDVSEEFYAARDEAEFCRLAGLDAPADLTGAGSETERIGPSGDGYRLLVRLTEEPGGTGHLVTLHLAVRALDDTEVCSLQFTGYWPA